MADLTSALRPPRRVASPTTSDRDGRPRPADADRAVRARLGAGARRSGGGWRATGSRSIVASTMRRAQETADRRSTRCSASRCETDPDLHELRQSDAFYAASPDFGDTRIAQLDAERPARLRAEPGAESFDDDRRARAAGARRAWRRARRAPSHRCLSHYGFLHCFLGAGAVRRRLRARAPGAALRTRATPTRASRLRAPPAAWTAWSSTAGPEDLERPGAPVAPRGAERR